MDCLKLQGSFTSAGVSKTLTFPFTPDWIRVRNYTQAATQQSTGRGIEFYWQKGMPSDSAFELKKTNSTDVANMVVITSGGFTPINSTQNILSALNTTVSAISTASTPVVSASSTAGLNNGDTVRLIDVAGAPQLNGLDFTIGSLSANTSFTLAHMAQLAIAGTTASFRRVVYSDMFAPNLRYISAITSSGTSSVIKTTVTNDYAVGQLVRIHVSDAYGMTQMDGLIAKITAVDSSANTITVNVDSSAFTAFAFPTAVIATNQDFTPAHVVAVAEDGQYPTVTKSQTYNTSYIGMKLAAGAQSPAGSTSDVIYWECGKSFSVNNE